MIESIKIATLYTLFAVVATSCNILTQEVYIHLDSSKFSLYFSILVGTVIGLIVKYFLDKKYIFKYETTSTVNNSKVFFLYAGMGVITTLIFWGFELAFHYAFATKEMRYLGGILGLIIGYIVKYKLDQRYVFIRYYLSDG